MRKANRPDGAPTGIDDLSRQMKEARREATAVREAVSRVTQELSSRQAEFTEVEQRLQQAREAHASTQADLGNLRLERERLTREQAEVQNQATQQRTDLQAQLARATDDLATRNREIAELEGRLQATRQELADAQGRFAGARQQLAAPPPGRGTSGAGAPTDAAPILPETPQ